MRKWFRSLFGQDTGSRSGPSLENSMQVNEVLARYRSAPGGAQPAPVATPAARKRRTEHAVNVLEVDFGEAGLSIDEPADDGMNPYDTGRFTASELWEKRYRDGRT